VPTAWKVAQDRTGLSARGSNMGFVITREPYLGDEKTFASQWRKVLADGGILTEVKAARAGRYKAVHATWPAKRTPDYVVEVFRVHVPDLEMLYNISFSAPKSADRAAIVEGVLKSFKVTAKGTKLELQETRVKVGGAGAIRLPIEFVKVAPGRRMDGENYERPMVGYKMPKLAGRITLLALPAGRRLQSGGNTGDPESINAWIVQTHGVGGGAFVGKTRNKSKSAGGLKGSIFTARYEGPTGDFYQVGLWSGKGKRECPVVLMIIHERELKLHRKYFSTILKSFKATKQ